MLKLSMIAAAALIGTAALAQNSDMGAGGSASSMPSGSGVTHALDVGGQFALGADDALTVGVVLRTLGFSLQVENDEQADPLPTRAGIVRRQARGRSCRPVSWRTRASSQKLGTVRPCRRCVRSR